MSLENLDHDRGERENKEERDKNKLPYSARFGTNENMMAARRKLLEEQKNKKGKK